MATPLPPHLQAAFEHLQESLKAAEKKAVDPVTTSWADLEKSVIKVLGGAFDLENPEHQAVALGLAGALGQRFSVSDGAFWFPNRESPEGAMLGFPAALIMLSPFGAVVDALSQSKLGKLEEVTQDLRRSLAQVKFAPGGGEARLTPDDYARLFDPGFIQFTVLDPTKVKTTLEAKPDKLAREIRDALGRTDKQLPAEARGQFEQQVAGALQRLDVNQTLGAQSARAPRLVELMIHLFGATAFTGSAPEEFWHDAVFPLAFIGAPASFPPLDEDELEAAKQGVDPFAIFLDTVPYATPSKDEGVLGVFEMQDIQVPHPDLAQAGPPRMLELKSEGLAKLITPFERAKTEETLKRFNEYLAQQAGKPVKASPPGEQMQDAALTLLTDLKKVVEEKGSNTLSMRRLTEAEATSEAALSIVRKALNGPRLILTGI